MYSCFNDSLSLDQFCLQSWVENGHGFLVSSNTKIYKPWFNLCCTISNIQNSIQDLTLTGHHLYSLKEKRKTAKILWKDTGNFIKLKILLPKFGERTFPFKLKVTIGSYLEAGGSIKELDNMPNASFRGLRKPWLQPLHHKENQYFSWQSRTIF